jgi:hypothetical protein
MSELTAYIVLRHSIADNGKPIWEVVDSSVRASSAKGAIRKAAETNLSATTDVYVAIPGRSFKPIAVQSVQQTILKLNASPDPT